MYYDIDKLIIIFFFISTNVSNFYSRFEEWFSRIYTVEYNMPGLPGKK